MIAVIFLSVLAGMAFGLAMVNHWLERKTWERDFLIGLAFLSMAMFMGGMQ